MTTSEALLFCFVGLILASEKTDSTLAAFLEIRVIREGRVKYLVFVGARLINGRWENLIDS